MESGSREVQEMEEWYFKKVRKTSKVVWAKIKREGGPNSMSRGYYGIEVSSLWLAFRGWAPPGRVIFDP